MLYFLKVILIGIDGMKWLFFLGWFLSSVIYAQPPTYLIGVSPSNPPLSLQANERNFFGFEIDIMNALCKRIKIRCAYKSVLASGVVSELAAGRIDFALAAIIRPAAPLEGFIFSLPYLSSGARFMTLKSSSINKPSEIEGKTVGVRRGTLEGGRLFENLILQIYRHNIKVVEYPTTNALMMALTNESIDILFTNAAVVDYWYYNNTTLYKRVGAKVPVGGGYAIMATTRQEMLITKINQALLEMLSDGSYLRVYNTYFSWE